LATRLGLAGSSMKGDSLAARSFKLVTIYPEGNTFHMTNFGNTACRVDIVTKRVAES